MRLVNGERVARDVIVIGGSAGGVKAIEALLGLLPAELPAFIGIVNHRSPVSSDWSRLFGRRSRLQVSEPHNGERVCNGHAYIAPADCHMRFHGGFIFLDRRPKQHLTRPAVDPMFESAAIEYGPRVVGALLSGGGTDGTEGMRCIWERGGLCLVQSDPEQPSMSENALEYDHVSAALTVPELADAIVLLTRGTNLSLQDRAAERPTGPRT